MILLFNTDDFIRAVSVAQKVKRLDRKAHREKEAGQILRLGHTKRERNDNVKAVRDMADTALRGER